MKKSIVVLVMVGLLGSMSLPAFAIKPLNDKMLEIYKDSADVPAAGKEAMKDAKCMLCHLPGPDKKKRNAYGIALAKELKESKFDLKAFKDEPNKYTTS